MICLLLAAFFLGIYVTVDEEMPGNAVVLVTLEYKHYHSIHFYFGGVAAKTATTMALSEAKRQGFAPHEHSINLGYFRGNRLFLYQYVLSKIGVHYNSRWDENGNWLW